MSMTESDARSMYQLLCELHNEAMDDFGLFPDDEDGEENARSTLGIAVQGVNHAAMLKLRAVKTYLENAYPNWFDEDGFYVEEPAKEVTP